MRLAAPAADAERLAAIAAARGAVVMSAPESIRIAGRDYTVLDVVCDSNERAVELLNDYARHDGERSEGVRRLAHTLCVRFSAAASAFEVDPGEAVARAIHAFVRDGIRFAPEDEQHFRSSDVTLALGQGNCVNTARLVAALACAAGIPARVVGVRDPDGEIGHAAAQLHVGGEWRWAEATIAAEFGEEPRAAGRRLGLVREDLR